MRAFSRKQAALACALAAGLAGCADPVINIGINLVTSACPGAGAQRDPTAGVDSLRITLTGDGLPTTMVDAAYTPGSGGSANIPGIPLGTNRRVTVEARVSSTNLVRASADSGPFDVTSSGDVQLTLFLRVVDAFVFTGSQDGTTCTTLNTPRAGHQMTLLPDGRVLITGGFNFYQGGATNYLTQAEIYDPRDGSFQVVGGAALYPRANHLAVPVPVNGENQVLLFGGEGPANGTIGPVPAFELYNSGAFTSVPLPSGAPARERAGMALDVKTGYAVMAGGINGPDVAGEALTAYDQVTYFNPQQDAVVEVAEPLAQPIFDLVAVARKNQASGGPARGGVVLIGGSTLPAGSSTPVASAQISGLLFANTPPDNFDAYIADTEYESAPLNALPAPRVHHAAIVANDDTIVVLGGMNSANDSYAQATDAVTVIAPAQALVGDATQTLSQPRADGCATLLASGDILYSGGAYGDANGLHSTSTVDVVTPSGTASTVRSLEGPGSAGGSWGLQAARHRAACVLLNDGTVLVTGGLQYDDVSGSVTALGSAEIYTPPGQ